ncbi:MAG: hypothetical protein EBT33_23530, partial [Betaproteobacteria bacterium]|nr:hypothetical protein [Betaproteobacteria bacterium]
AGRFWKMIQEHKATIFYTAPTASTELTITATERVASGQTTAFNGSLASAVLPVEVVAPVTINTVAAEPLSTPGSISIESGATSALDFSVFGGLFLERWSGTFPALTTTETSTTTSPTRAFADRDAVLAQLAGLPQSLPQNQATAAYSGRIGQASIAPFSAGDTGAVSTFQRLRGTLTVPAAGDYKLRLLSNGAATVFVQTTANGQSTAAVSHTYSSASGQPAVSAAIPLTAGQQVQIDIRHFDAAVSLGQGRGLELGWERPDGVIEAVIPARYLTPLQRPTGSVTVTIDAPTGYALGAAASSAVTVVAPKLTTLQTAQLGLMGSVFNSLGGVVPLTAANSATPLISGLP